MPVASTLVSTSVARHQFDGITRPEMVAASTAAHVSSGLPAASSAKLRFVWADASRLGRPARR